MSCINAIKHTSLSKSRMPWLNIIMNLIPFSYYIVPGYFYNKRFGIYDFSLGCPYKRYAIKENLELIQKVYEKLTDDYSKRTYLDVLLYRLTLDKKYLYDCLSSEPDYFIPELCGLKNETVVDCGAYVGDTLEDYLKFNEEPKKYFLYEPDKKNMNIIKSKIDEIGASKYCVLRNVGVGDANRFLTFSENKGESSHFSSDVVDDYNKVEIVALDNDISEDVSFIKMDIEGFEMAALQGCLGKLKKHPKLAICIYHKIEDLWQIPNFLFDFYPKNTKYIVRHYSDICWSTVFFVIPLKEDVNAKV